MTETSTSARPLWLLDVDGVLNFVHKDPASQWPDVEQFMSSNGYRISWSPTMLKRIRAVHDRGLAEVRWLTTWEDLANVYLADTFGLPALTVAGCRPFPDSPRDWWKLPHAQTAYATGARIVWTDDDIAYDQPAKDWLSEIGRDRMMAISPRGGLLPEHLDLIEQWLASEVSS